MFSLVHFRYLLSLLMAFALLPLAVAQQNPPTGGGTGGSGGTTSGTRGDTSKPPVTTRPQTDTPRPPRQNPQVLFISGTVVMEDGSPVPNGAVIERVCAGRVKKEAFVSSNGFFGFEIGGLANSSIIPEASDDSIGGLDPFGGRSSQPGMFGNQVGPSSSTSLMGCELRAQLGGYRSSVIMLDGFSPMGQLDVGTIVLQSITKVAGTTISLTDMQAPKEAKKALERATKAISKKDYGEAEKNLRSALDSYPSYATAWFQMGQIYQSQQRIADAREAYGKAIAADSKYVNPYIQLARLAGMEQKWQEVADLSDRALALDSLDFPEGYFYNALAYYVLNKLDIAERSARKAQRLDPQHRLTRVHIVLADILQKKQDYAGSAEQLQAYLKYDPKAPDVDKIRARIEDLIQRSKTMASTQPDN